MARVRGLFVPDRFRSLKHAAAAVGAGGLGELIFRGVASVDNGLVLAGAVPAALLALCADGALGWFEKRLVVRR